MSQQRVLRTSETVLVGLKKPSPHGTVAWKGIVLDYDKLGIRLALKGLVRVGSARVERYENPWYEERFIPWDNVSSVSIRTIDSVDDPSTLIPWD